ncbi:MAG TPA: hypothetical protein VFR67_16435 [Pilimelia sp.]|nr:hypothetical protein [Pilimelia sp.]
MVSVSGHAYPWDVIGDPAFPGRVRDLGLESVTLAAAYHTTRAATPLHPGHQIVHARYAAFYRPVDESEWAGRRLRPAAPQWMNEPDSFGTAAAALAGAGLAVTAWIVLTHSTRLGSAFPDVAVVNCFGELYPYALCPSHPEVRDYAARLAAAAVRDVPLAGISLEACGQMGLVHLNHHEKTDGAWTPAAVRWLSVCCCRRCRDAWHGDGLDPDEVSAALRAAVRGEATGEPAPPPEKTGEAVLAARHAATDELRRQVLAAVRDQAPGVPVTLHAHPDPWATGASPGLTPTAAADVAAVLVPAWPTVSATVDVVAHAAAAGAPVEAYVTVLPPADPDAVVSHARRLVEAGARGLALYHLGLASSPGQRLLSEIVAAVRT